ncbi:MAG: type II toxin-antitoxin system HicB family antitoxin [Chloroflexi bacterium]|nr:type II toxin-antitoxin system HicB family antitoxin [Chloroflexota bacterium]
MNRQLLEQAEKLGNRTYQMKTFLDKTTDGESVYVALIPELPGCHTHGNTEEEALKLLNEVKVEFIYFMLEDELAVPEPKNFDRHTTINVRDICDTNSSKRTVAHNRLSLGSGYSVSGPNAIHSGRLAYVV